MPFVRLTEVTEIEPVPGFHARFVHGDKMSWAFWTIDAGSELPEHRHPHEQVGTVLEGEFEITLDGETRVVGPGDVFVIPSNVPHAGRAVTACRMLDVFQPVREDYR